MRIHIPAFVPMAKCNEHLAHGPIDIDLGPDVVPVVRCKDCKYITPVEGGLPLCSLRNIACAYNDFCSNGERKDGES